MSEKRDHEAENRGAPYEPSKRPGHVSQEPGAKPPRKEDRAREHEDNKTG